MTFKLQFNKTIDNQFYVPELTSDQIIAKAIEAESIITQGLQINTPTQGVGNRLAQTSDGVQWVPPFGDRNILVGSDQVLGYRTAPTVYDAIQIANAMTPPPSQDLPVNFILVNSTFETNKLSLTDGMQITGNFTGGLFFVNLTVPFLVELGDPDGIWITLGSGEIQFNEVRFNGLNICNTIVQVTPGNNSLATNCFFTGAGLSGSGSGVCIDIQAASDYIINETFFYTVNAAAIGSFDLTIEGDAVVVNSGARLTCQSIVGFPANFDGVGASFLNGDPFDFLKVEDSGFAVLNTSYLQRLATAAFNDSGELLTQGLILLDCDTAIRCASNTSSSVTNVFSTFIQNSTTYDLRVDDDLSTVNMSATTLTQSKSLFPANQDNLFLSFFETSDNYFRGSHFRGTIVFGSQDSNSNIYMGQGAIDGNDTVILKWDGISFTDVSANLSNATRTPTTMFDDLTNSILYISDGHKFSTILYNVITPLIIGTGVILAEYWNGSIWVPFNSSTSIDTTPYVSLGRGFATVTGALQTRFDIDIVLSTNWVLSTINSIENYWTRFRITSPITQSPVVDFIGVLTDTQKFDNTGVQLSFGRSRVRKTIPLDINSLIGIGSTKPLDSDIWASQRLNVGRSGNRFKVGDIAGVAIPLPPDLDSSCKVQFEIGLISNSTAAAQPAFNFRISSSCVVEGTRIYLTAANALGVTTTNEIQQTVGLPVNQTNGQFLQIDRTELDVSSCIILDANGDTNTLFFINFERVTDTNPNDCVFIQLSVYYTAYIQGGLRV